MAEPCQALVVPSDCPDAGSDLPDELRCSGLYADWEKRSVGCYVRAYTPAFELWSDAAKKQRYVWLPVGQTVDASDPNGFVYPVGTQFWKEFRVEGTLAETRLLRKGVNGWLYTSYVWTQDGSRALRNDQGVTDLFASGHTVPTHDQCRECHAGRPDFVLGWDWLLLDDTELRARVVPQRTESIPGDEVERAALGYLHVNCGVSCHNETAGALAREIAFQTRLELGELASVQTTDVVRTGINRTPNWWSTLFVWGSFGDGFLDLRPGDPARSYALARMNVRGGERQMPRLGTNRVDREGVRIVRAWIEHMSEARGYPAPAP